MYHWILKWTDKKQFGHYINMITGTGENIQAECKKRTLKTIL
jgi:hypothetical protein